MSPKNHISATTLSTKTIIMKVIANTITTLYKTATISITHQDINLFLNFIFGHMSCIQRRCTIYGIIGEYVSCDFFCRFIEVVKCFNHHMRPFRFFSAIIHSRNLWSKALIFVPHLYLYARQNEAPYLALCSQTYPNLSARSDRYNRRPAL